MKIERKTISVVLSAPDGDARFTFGRMKENRRQELLSRLVAAQDALEQATKAQDVAGQRAAETSCYRALQDYNNAVLESCQAVEGLENEDGQPVTPADVQTRNLYADIIAAICAAYWAAQNVEAAKGAEKKEATNGELPNALDSSSSTNPDSTVATATSSDSTHPQPA